MLLASQVYFEGIALLFAKAGDDNLKSPAVVGRIELEDGVGVRATDENCCRVPASRGLQAGIIIARISKVGNKICKLFFTKTPFLTGLPG